MSENTHKIGKKESKEVSPLRVKPELRKAIEGEVYRLQYETGERVTYDEVLVTAWDCYQKSKTPQAFHPKIVKNEVDLITITVPADLLEAVQEFLHFATNPLPGDVEWRNVMLQLFRDRAAKRRSASV